MTIDEAQDAVPIVAMQDLTMKGQIIVSAGTSEDTF
jgi:hypothetical protein